jgi:hypothetical protein
VDLFGEGVWDTSLDEGDMRSDLRFLLACVPRVCRAPNAARSFVYDPLQYFTALDAAGQAAILKAPDRSFEVIDKACIRKNDGRAIGCGVLSLCRILPKLLVPAFEQCPGPLVRAARILGLLSTPDREGLVTSLREGALFEDPTGHDASRLVELLDARGRPDAVSIVSKRLRQHVDGEVVLKPDQLNRHVQRLREGWNAVLCDELEAAAVTLMKERVGVETIESDAMRHAVLLQTTAEEHRRSLRRLLVAHARGDNTWLRSHPANQLWLARHPRIDPCLWAEGIGLERELEGLGRISLRVETNPLEALRLGTYVGSCLGIGGRFTYSAAAIVLDINK